MFGRIADCPGDFPGDSLPAGHFAVAERRPRIAPGPRQGEADQVALLSPEAQEGQPPLDSSSRRGPLPARELQEISSSRQHPGPPPSCDLDLPSHLSSRGLPTTRPATRSSPLRHLRLRRLRGPLERRGGGNGLPRRSPLLHDCTHCCLRRGRLKNAAC